MGLLCLAPQGAVALELSVEVIAYQGFEEDAESGWRYTASPGNGGLVEVVSSRSHSGTNSMRLRGSNKLNADPYVVFDNLSLAGYTNVRLSVAFSASGPDRNDDLYLEVSYDNGMTWRGEDSVRLASGFNNAQIPFGETRTGDPWTVPENPYLISLRDDATQVMVRVRFDEVSNSNGSLDSYFIDDLCLSYVPPGQPPIIRALTNRVAWVGHPLSFWVVADDIDRDAIDLWAESLPDGAAFAPVSGTETVSNLFTFTPVEADADQVYTTVFVVVDAVFRQEAAVVIEVQDKVVNFVGERETVAEDSPSFPIWASISRAADATVHVAVAGSALPEADYTLSSTTLVFTASGSLTQSVVVTCIDDILPEGLETADLALVDPRNARIGDADRFRVSIRDNDSFSIAAANLTSGGGQIYREPGARILKGLCPDIVAIQEFNVTNLLGRREFVDLHFGTNFSFFVGAGTLPCGVISRWPIVDAGEWADPVVSGRDFVWATIAIPGARKLNLVSVHLYASGSMADREQEARILTNAIASAGFDPDDFLAIAGDLNAQHRAEPAVLVLSEIASDAWRPSDQAGIHETNQGRNRPYDYVLPNALLDARRLPVRLEGLEFSNGLVFDTRLWTNPPPPHPVRIDDSDAYSMAHMAVMKLFAVEPVVRIFTSTDGSGTVAPANPVALAGSDFPFRIQADSYWHLASLQTNGYAMAAPLPTDGIEFTWSNLTADATLEAVFAANTTVYDTPEWWLADYGWTNDFEAAALDDPDEDEMATWEEYVAGTDPLSPASRFVFVHAQALPTGRTLYWPSIADRFYTVLRSTNALCAFEPIAVDLPGTPPYNVFVDSQPGAGPAFYRVTVRR